MTLLAKVLIGAGVTVVVGGTAAYAIHKSEEKKKDIAEVAVSQDEDKSVIKKIKRFVRKKVIKFLAWVALHMEQIEAASAVIGLASGVIGIASAVRDYAKGNDMQAKLDEVNDKLNSIIKAYDANLDINEHNDKERTDWMYHNFRVINDNVIKVADKLEGVA